MSSEFDLESFSRIGKSLSNASSLRSIRESLESSRQQTRRSREISFVSLSEVNTQIVDFHVDRGRHAVMLSSPRSESLQDSSSTTRNPFQHLVSLEDKNSLRASKMRKRQADKLHENRFISQRGSRELDAKPPKEKLVLPSSSFLAPERKESVYYKMQDKRYAAVPPIGHYDASYELVRPKTARLCYIAAKQHNVRSSSPQGHFKVSETHFTRSKSFEYAPSSISKSVENEMTSSPFNLRGEEERLMFSPQERKENSRDLQESISQVSFRRGHDPSEIQSTDQNSWLRPEKTQDFNKTSGRFVGDRALIAGYLALSRKEMFDLEYSPSVEILEITKRHTPTPDLSRSGRDHNDALERLGYVTPERTAATPYYPKVADPIRWSEQRNWFHATHPNNNKASVNMKTMLPRKWTSSGKAVPLGLDLREESNSNLHLFNLKESHPMSRHIPSFEMRKSNSSHAEKLKTSSRSEWAHDPSFSLVYPRPSSVPRFDKMTNRVPLSSVEDEDLHTNHDGEPNYAVLRPRSLSPVRISKQVGRESHGGVMQKTGAGGLHGLDYWDGVRQAQGSLRSASPDFNKTIGREKNSILDSSMREMMQLARTIDSHFVEPYSKVGVKAYREGKESGEIWHPKDNVQIHRVHRVSLDSNSRSRVEVNKLNSSTGGEPESAKKFKSAFVDNILQKQRSPVK